MGLSIDALLGEQLAAYTEEVKQELEEVISEVAEETAESLQANSPKRKGSGRYAKSWKVKKSKGGKNVVYNDKHYRITHLLEYGHAKRNGGRTSEIVHIKPIEEEAIKHVEEAIRERLGG